MAGCKSCLLVSTLVLAVGVGLLLNVTIPDGFQEPLKLRLALGSLKFLRRVSEMIYTPEENMRMIRHALAHKDMETDLTGVKTRDTGFNGVDVRIYVPEGRIASDAAVIYFHGGGWVFGSHNGTTHSTMVEMTQRLKITVVSVDYRLAPEHPYPTPFEDCVTATKYFLKNAQNYGVNPDRVALMGDSAGGNLAAAVSLLLRDDDYDYQPKLQVLIYPALQAVDLLTPSYQLYQDEPLLHKSLMVRFWLWYAFGDLDDFEAAMANLHTSPDLKKQMAATKLNHETLASYRSPTNYQIPDLQSGNLTLWEEIADIFEDPYFTPLMADDLTGLPQAYILTAEQDVLRDDGIWYAQRLRAAGNDVTHQHMNSVFHVLLSLPMFQDCHVAWEKVYEYVEKEL